MTKTAFQDRLMYQTQSAKRDMQIMRDQMQNVFCNMGVIQDRIYTEDTATAWMAQSYDRVMDALEAFNVTLSHRDQELTDSFVALRDLGVKVIDLKGDD